MLALAFLNPLLLWAVPLCAVPIVIHLLNRRRFQRVPWAAMEFLLAALKRNRKRLRMEQWLVLLLRTLAVLLLAFLVARPQLSGGSLIGTRTHHVVLLDDSASMSQRSGSLTLWNRAVDEVRRLADRLGETRGGDLFSLVRTGHATTPELWGQRIGPDLGRRVGALLKELAAGDGPMDLAAVLASAHTRAQESKEAGFTDYTLVTDLRTIDWLTEDDRARPPLQAALASLAPDTEHLNVHAVGARDADNIAVVAVRQLGRLTAVGVQLDLAIDVQNFGLDASQTTELAIEMDGKSRIVRPVPPLSPGERISVPASHTFHSSGHHRIEASLPMLDHYPLDDRRVLVLPVPEGSKALLVDGEPGESTSEGETMFLQVALDPGSDPPTGIEPHVVTDTAFAELDLAPFDAIYLCNVAAPSPAVVEKLEHFVAGGGGLVIYVGAQVDPARYNELLWRGGQGLLPLQLGDIAGDPDRPEHLFLAQKDHPVCGDLGDALEVFCNVLVLIKRYLPMLDDPRSGAAVMARIRDAEGAPAIVSKTFGSGGGQVVVFGFAADKHWSNWPDTPANLVVAQQSHRVVTKVHELGDSNLTTRGVYRIELDPGLYRADVEVAALTGDGEQHTITAVAPKVAAAPAGQVAPAVSPTAPPLLAEVDMAELRTIGAFEARLLGHGGNVETRLFARNVPLAESRLVRLASSDFARAFPPELADRVTFREEGAGVGSDAGQGEIWRALAAAMLAALVLETLLAWRFGRR